MHILFLMPGLPYPPHQGTALRNFGLLEGLAQRGYTVSLATFGEAGPVTTPLVALCEHLIVVPTPHRSTVARVRTLLSSRADLSTRLESAAMHHTLAELLTAHRFDCIQIEGLEMAPYIATVQRHAPETPLIYDAHNAEHALQTRIAEQDAGTPRGIYSRVQADRLTRLEAEVCRASARVLACSEHDAAALRALEHNTPVDVVPNAVHTSEYAHPTKPVEVPRPALVFTGKMDFRPNVDAALWFADEILPLLDDGHFVVVGKNPHPRLERLRTSDRVTLTGFVPHIEPYLHAADVYVAPLRMGGGTRFKLLQTMAAGRPVVSTTVGAEGLTVRGGEHLLLADEPEAFARAVQRLLSDEELRTTLKQSARTLVQEHYDWQAVIPLVEEAYSALRG